MFLLISGIIFLIFSVLVNAQQVGLSINPPLVELISRPGKSVLVAFTVKNFSSDDQFLRVNLKSFIPKGGTGNIQIQENLEGPVLFSLENSLIRFNKPFLLEKGKSEQILLKISIPDKVEEKDYYYTLLIETVDSGISGDKNSAFSRVRIGANIIITVTDDIFVNYKPKIVFFDVIPAKRIQLFGLNLKIFDIGDPVPVLLKVANIGDNFFKTKGFIELQSMTGEVKKYSLLPQNVLAGSERVIYASSEAGLKNIYNKRKVSFVFDSLGIGKYVLRTSVRPEGEGGKELFSSTEFFVFPIKISAGIIIIFVLLLFFSKRKSK